MGTTTMKSGTRFGWMGFLSLFLAMTFASAGQAGESKQRNPDLPYLPDDPFAQEQEPKKVEEKAEPQASEDAGKPEPKDEPLAHAVRIGSSDEGHRLRLEPGFVAAQTRPQMARQNGATLSFAYDGRCEGNCHPDITGGLRLTGGALGGQPVIKAEGNIAFEFADDSKKPGNASSWAIRATAVDISPRFREFAKISTGPRFESRTGALRSLTDIYVTPFAWAGDENIQAMKLGGGVLTRQNIGSLLQLQLGAEAGMLLAVRSNKDVPVRTENGKLGNYQSVTGGVTLQLGESRWYVNAQGVATRMQYSAKYVTSDGSTPGPGLPGQVELMGTVGGGAVF